MVDSIIFDMDGTLVNNLKQMVVSWNLTCKRYGWNKEITYEEMKSCMGLNGHDIGVKLFPNIDEDEATRRVEVCSAEEVDYFDQVEIGYTYIPNEEYLEKALIEDDKTILPGNGIISFEELDLINDKIENSNGDYKITQSDEKFIKKEPNVIEEYKKNNKDLYIENSMTAEQRDIALEDKIGSNYNYVFIFV